MKFLILVSLFLVLSCSAMADWEAFKSQHGKNYAEKGTDEFRHKQWLRTSQMIEEHNKRYQAGEVSFFVGHNEMSDWTAEERRQFVNCFKMSELPTDPKSPRTSAEGIPESVDWRTKGAVTPIKNQGACGACWAFSAIAAIEGSNFIRNDQLVSFSEQQLVECSNKTFGCNGGNMDDAFKYAMDTQLETEESYPYTGQQGRCKYDKSHGAVTVKAIMDLPSGDENWLQKSIASFGAVSVAIDASDELFAFYKGGIYDSKTCGNTFDKLNHAVTVVGFGSETDIEYYIVKNSWGTQWGEDGYIRMSRNKDNQCGIATVPSYPMVSRND